MLREQVRLVVPIHLELALTQRHDGAPYGMARGSATVVAKTMKRDGLIEVLIDASSLYDIDETGEIRRTAAGQVRLGVNGLIRMRHYVTHEAQHVIMMQRGSGFEAYETATHKSRWAAGLYSTAAKMCDEHRAQWNAIRLASPGETAPNDIHAELSEMGSALAAAYSRYQSSDCTELDNSDLYRSVFRACSPFWIAMAYWVSEYRSDGGFRPVGSAIEKMDLWQR
jgi:hypothetical protein